MKLEGAVCRACAKGKLVKIKENLHFGKITLLNQTIYVCDICDSAFQTKDDYNHMNYLCSLVGR